MSDYLAAGTLATDVAILVLLIAWFAYDVHDRRSGK